MTCRVTQQPLIWSPLRQVRLLVVVVVVVVVAVTAVATVAAVLLLVLTVVVVVAVFDALLRFALEVVNRVDLAVMLVRLLLTRLVFVQLVQQ